MKRVLTLIVLMCALLVGFALAQAQSHISTAQADPCLVWGPVISFFVQLVKGWIRWVKDNPQIMAALFSAVATAIGALGGNADVVAVLVCFAVTLGLSVGTYEVIIKRFAKQPAA